MKHFNTSRTMLWLMVLLSSLSTYAQNQMVGDGFGGRAGYKPVNYTLAYQTGFAVCGSNKQLYAWGSANSSYTFGTGSPSPSSSTTPVVASSSLSNLLQVSAYQPGYSAAIRNDGTGWVWSGLSGWGTVPQFTPMQIVTDAYFVSAGDQTISFVKKDGTVVSVGENTYGLFGDGTTTNSCYSATCPVKMNGITNAKRIATGSNNTFENFSIILLADGTVKQVGYISTSTSPYNSKTPVVVPGLSNIVDVKAYYHISSLALTASGQVYEWSPTSPTPTLVTFPAGAAPIKAIIAESTFVDAMVIDDNGNLYGWGANSFGELGIGSQIYQPTPKLITTNVRDVKITSNCAYIFKTDGTMWLTGTTSTSTNNLGLGSPSGKNLYPVQITPPCAIMDFNGMPPCVAGTTAPAVTPTTATNSCPTTTVNLGSLAISSTTPSGAKLIWSTHKVPTSAADTLTTAQKTAVSTAGTYYALYYDATNACYSPADSVVVTMTTCAPITVTNTCPTATVNLMTAISATNMPSGASITWHTGTPATAANQVATPTAVSTSGTYYLAFFDGIANCYSDVSQTVTVTITPCVTPLTVNNAPAQTATTGSAKTGNAATELAPTGGTSPYIYSNGAGDAACVAPSGATALTGLTVNSDGTYSYTAPATAGTYYYCIKVCDSATPTASCIVKTYTLTVSPNPLAANTPAAQTASVGAAKTGNAATELAPTGGVSPYTYSNGAGDAACVAPSGATALTGLTVNSNGTYSYTAPATAGTYYYCIKVCDSATPTASCIVKTYTLTVSPNPLAANTPAAQSGYPTEVKTGNAATELAPTGGTSPYTYSLANNDAACVAPSGATAITGATTISINSTTGEYTYTVPSTLPNTSKTFYFCVKVCDSATPTASCVVKTYTVNATASTLAIAATSADKAEGNSGTTPFTFTVTRSGNTTGPASVGWYTGTGTNPVDATDFVPASLPMVGTVNFAAGETSKVITINVAGDNTIETDETFKVTLTNSGFSLVTTAVANGTIQNDDVALSANDPAAQTASVGAAKTGNAATELAPTGGVSPYTYSNGAGDVACVAPSGATALTGLTVNSNGTYSYTAPATAGTYYYCIKVCDSATPTASCIVKTYTLTVSPNPLAANTPAAQSASVGAAKTGNAATELAPTGGVSPYTYSNGAGDAACVAPSGATLLTGLTVNSDGTYSYTAPTTAGTYYYCIKVCDSTTPTAQCVVKTYTLTVTAAASCTISNIMPTFIKN